MVMTHMAQVSDIPEELQQLMRDQKHTILALY